MKNTDKINKLRKIKYELLSIGTGAIVAMSLTACSSDNKEEKKQEDALKNEKKLVKEINGNVKKGDTKVFEPGEHYISVRVIGSYQEEEYYKVTDNHEYNCTGSAISNIPEGYKLYTILPITRKHGYGSTTAGYEAWFVNTEIVEVKATYNKYYDNYGYYDFGKVIENNKVKTYK